MTVSNQPYHYDYTRLDKFLTYDYDLAEVVDTIRKTRMAIAELMAVIDFASDWIFCYRFLFDLEEIFLKLQPAA
jgi:hypothetical protein